MRRLASALVTTLALGCGAHAPPPPAPLAPATDRDPEPWVPPPASEAPAGGTVSLSIAGGDAQARLVALRVVTTIRDGDEASLLALLDDPLARAQPRPSAARIGREQIVEMAMRSPRRSDLATEATLEELVEVEQIEVMPLSELMPSPPEGLLPTDWVVYLPLTATGRRSFRFLLNGWHLRGAVIVRDAGGGPRVVGL
ncbi:MAG: hypothetical protein KF901_01925 [Myxococcales bacterium]|nr:hypothetical protein [Myxococcales bacterium]